MTRKYLFVILNLNIFLLTNCGKNTPDIILDRDQFIGSYSGSEICDISTPTLFSVSIEKHSADKNKIILKNFDSLGLNIEATVENETFTFVYNEGSVALGGVGELEENSLILNYSKAFGGGNTDNCVAIAPKNS